MATEAEKGIKVEELIPQPSAYTSSGSGAPRRTLLQKEGSSNVSYKGIERKPLKYLKDLYVTLIDLQWRYVLLLVFAAIFFSYLFFALLYWFLCYMRGQYSSAATDQGFKPCIHDLDGIMQAFLFSMETQSTIGFGALNPESDCPGVVPLVFLQITVGFMIETFILGFLFVKFARPKHRRHTLVFSRNACLVLEDGCLTFQIRVGDMRQTHLVDCTVHGLLVKRKVMTESHVYPLFQHRMPFQAHRMGEKVFLMWPLVLSHVITRDSPLYDLSPTDVYRDKFDVLVFLEGTIESTGELCQARTCYASRDILWGHRFVRLEEWDEVRDTWCCDFARFNNVLPSLTPKLSARDYDEERRTARERKEEKDTADENIYDNAVDTKNANGDKEEFF